MNINLMTNWKVNDEYTSRGIKYSSHASNDVSIPFFITKKCRGNDTSVTNTILSLLLSLRFGNARFSAYDILNPYKES